MQSTPRAAFVVVFVLLITLGAVRTAEKNGSWWRDNPAGPDSSNYVDRDQIKSSVEAPGRNGSVSWLSGAVGVPPHPEMRAQHATSRILPFTLCPPD